MKCRVSGCVFVLLFVLQLSNAEGDQNEEDQLLLLNKKVENFIKQILHTIQSYRNEMRGNSNCISDEVVDSAVETLRRSIDCVDNNEKDYGLGKINAKVHRKQFLMCFSKAKEEVQNQLRNSTQSTCPEKPTEKTYEINVTTAMTKTFLIRIRNGVNVINKKFQLNHVDEPSPDFKEESKSGVVENSSEDLEFERKGSTETQTGTDVGRHNDTISDEIDIDQRNLYEDEDEDDSTMKDEAEVEEMQGFVKRNSTAHHDEEESDSEEEYDYDSYSF